MPKFQPILAKLGESWEVSSSLVSGLEEFTCAVYGRKRFSGVDKLRYELIKEKCSSKDGSIKLHKNVDLSVLPPCSRVFIHQIHRANYQMCIWRNAHIPIHDVPSPADGHGWKQIDGHLKPLWFEGDFVPQVVVDTVTDDNQDLSDSDDNPEDYFMGDEYDASDSGDEL